MNLLDVGKTIKLNHIDLTKESVIIPCNSFGKIQDWNYNLITLVFRASEEIKYITFKDDVIKLLIKSGILTIVEEPLTTDVPKYQENQLVKNGCGNYGLIDGEPKYDAVNGTYCYRIVDIESLLLNNKYVYEEYECELESLDKCELEIDYLDSPIEYKVIVEKIK